MKDDVKEKYFVMIMVCYYLFCAAALIISAFFSITAPFFGTAFFACALVFGIYGRYLAAQVPSGKADWASVPKRKPRRPILGDVKPRIQAHIVMGFSLSFVCIYFMMQHS